MKQGELAKEPGERRGQDSQRGRPCGSLLPGETWTGPARLAAQGPRARLTGRSGQQLRSPSFLPPHVHVPRSSAIPSFTHTVGEERLLFFLSLPRLQGFPPVDLGPTAPLLPIP